MKTKKEILEMNKEKLENYKIELINSIPTYKNIDCNECTDCSDCNECTDCTNCTNCTDCYNCSKCTDCFDCYECTNCSNCTDCSNLVNGLYCHNLKFEAKNYDKYYICNIEVTQEEYNKKLKEIKEK